MRRHLWAGVSLLVVALAGAAAYAELVLDWRAPRSELGLGYSLSTNILFVPEDYQAVIDAMKKKWGEKADTRYYSQAMHVRTTLDGKLVEESPFRARAELYGIFVVGPKRSDDDGIFPVLFEQWEAPQDGRGNERTNDIKERLQKGFAAKYLAFSQRDWQQASCFVAPPEELGLNGTLTSLLGVRPSTACVSQWRGRHAGAMLVGLHVVDGGDWTRLFALRACRWLTEATLAKHISAGKPAPNFAACVFLDRRYLHAVKDSLVTYVYALRPDRSLALIP